MQHLFEIGLATHEHGLHLFRRLVFEIFAQIAIGPRNRNLFCVLRNFFLDELFVLGFAPMQAAPGNDERFRFLLWLRACDHRFELGIKFDDSREHANASSDRRRLA